MDQQPGARQMGILPLTSMLDALPGPLDFLWPATRPRWLCHEWAYAVNGWLPKGTGAFGHTTVMLNGICDDGLGQHP